MFFPWLFNQILGNSRKKFRNKLDNPSLRFLGLLEGAGMAEVEEVVDAIGVHPDRPPRRRQRVVPLRRRRCRLLLRVRVLQWLHRHRRRSQSLLLFFFWRERRAPALDRGRRARNGAMLCTLQCTPWMLCFVSFFFLFIFFFFYFLGVCLAWWHQQASAAAAAATTTIGGTGSSVTMGA